MSKNGDMSLLEHMVREELKLPVKNLVLDLVLEISKEIPNNVNDLSPSRAQYLAGRFLKGMDMCAELCTIATRYEMQKEVLKKKEHGDAFLQRAKGQGLKTVKEKEAYADTDEDYLNACEVFHTAKAFRVRVDMLRRDFEKAHYHMRRLAENDVAINDKESVMDAEINWAKQQKVDNNNTTNTRRSWGE